MLAYYMREAYLLLEEGASVEQIDRALVDFGMPVGPFAMQDIAGIDVGARIRQHLAKMGKTRAEVRSQRCRTGCSNSAAMGRRPAPVGTATSRQPNADSRSADQRDRRSSGGQAGHRRGATDRRRRDRGEDYHRDGQRGAADSRGRLRQRAPATSM